MDNEILCKIMEIIKLNIEWEEMRDIQPDENLEELGMDSLAYIRIIVALEEEFKCEIPEEKLLVSDMNTVAKIYKAMVPLNIVYENVEIVYGE